MIKFIQAIPIWFFIIIWLFWIIGIIIYNIFFKKKESPIESKEQFVETIKNDIPNIIGFVIAFLIIYFKSDFFLKEILFNLSGERQGVIAGIMIGIIFLIIKYSTTKGIKIIWKLLKNH